MPAIRVAGALLLTVCLAAPAGGAGQWVRLRTQDFTLVGNVGERELRDVAARLEQFRVVLARLVPGLQVREALPTTVFVFRDRQSMAPYRPMFEGKPIELAGYFSRSEVGRRTRGRPVRTGGGEGGAVPDGYDRRGVLDGHPVAFCRRDRGRLGDQAPITFTGS